MFLIFLLQSYVKYPCDSVRHFSDCWLCCMMLYLTGLEAHAGSISAEHDIMFTVEPQQTVVHGSHQLLCSPRHFFILERRPTAHPVHAVHQNLSSVCKVLHRVYTNAGLLHDHAHNQPLVGYSLGDGAFISWDNGQDIRNEVSHTVVAQVDPKMCEERSWNLQEITPLKLGNVIGVCFQLHFVLVSDQSCEKAAEELQEKHGLRSELDFWSLGKVLSSEAEEGRKDYRPRPILIQIYRKECHMFSETQYTMAYSLTPHYRGQKIRQNATKISFYFWLRFSQHGANLNF